MEITVKDVKGAGHVDPTGHLWCVRCKPDVIISGAEYPAVVHYGSYPHSREECEGCGAVLDESKATLERPPAGRFMMPLWALLLGFSALLGLTFTDASAVRLVAVIAYLVAMIALSRRES